MSTFIGGSTRPAHFLARMRQRYIEQANPAIVGELRDRLTRWLYHHILIQDVAYKPYVLATDGGDTVVDEVSQPPPLPGHCLPTAIVP